MPTPKPAKSNAFAPLSDELFDIDKELAPHRTSIKREEAIRKAMRAGCIVKAEEQWTIQGLKSITILGPCGTKRVIDYDALVKAISATMYAKFATCTLTDLEKHVAPAIIAAVVSEEQTGSRDLKTFAKGAKGS